MATKKIIITVLSIVLVFFVILGIFWSIKNSEKIVDYKNILVSKLFEKEKPSPITENKILEEQKPALEEMIKEKQKRHDELSAKINEAKNTCNKASDLLNVDKDLIAKLNQDNITQTVSGYFTCEAIQKKDLNKCNFLKDVDQKRYESCMMSGITIQLTQEKCSIESISRCGTGGILNASDCSNMCDVYVNGKNSACEFLKSDVNLYNGCLSITKKDVNLCNNVTDSLQKDSCINDYYLNLALKNNNKSLIDKMVDSYKKLFAKAIFDNEFSCQQEFSKFISNEGCIDNLLGGDYKKIDEEMVNLKQELDQLNVQYQGSPEK